MHFSESPRLTPPEPKGQGGRPTTFCEEIAERIVGYIAETNLSLREICAQHTDLPGRTTIYRWRLQYPEFDAQIRLAQAGRIEDLELECIGIADQAASGAKVAIAQDGKETEISITTPINYLDRQLKTRLMIVQRYTAGMAGGAAGKSDAPVRRALAPPPEDDPLRRAQEGWLSRGLIEAKTR